MQDAYVALGVPYGSGEEESRRAYRRLISAWHPDRNSSNEAHQKTLLFNAAISALENVGFSPEMSDRDFSFRFTDPFHHPANERGFGDFYEYVQPVKAARAINRKVKLTLEEAAFGSVITLRGKTRDVCTMCGGDGNSDDRMTCAHCSGRGYTTGGPAGYYKFRCDSCNGFGYFLSRCPKCRGSGKQPSRDYDFRVNLPPGVRDGETLVARGVGGLGSDGKTRSDARIIIEMKKHDFFFFDDDDYLTINVPVLITEWLRSEEISVPTLYGPQIVPLKPLQFDYILPGFGYPDRSGQPDDLHVKPILATPTTSDPALLRYWKDIEQYLLRRQDPEFVRAIKKREVMLQYTASTKRKTDS